MLPIRNKMSKDLIEQEGQILLTISNFQNNKIPTIAEVTRIYNIPYTTLQDQLKSIKYKDEKRANNHKLTQSKEESLIK